MNVVPMNTGACGKTRRYLDSFVSGELLVETNHEVLGHIDACRECRDEYEQRVRLRQSLRRAVDTEAVPVDLAVRVRQKISEYEENRPMFSFRQWSLIAAATLLMAAGTVWTVQFRNRPLYEYAAAGQETLIEKWSQSLTGAIKVGLGDHAHCTLARKPDAFPKPSQLDETRVLKEDWKPLETVVRQVIPARFELIHPHRCTYRGRRFVHFAFRDNAGELASVIVADKRDKETLNIAELAPALKQAGIPVYQQSTGNYHVAAFESDHYMAYVVSEMPERENLRIAASLAESARDFLAAPKSAI